MADVIVIGIAGGTGSGKTTLVKALINRFGDDISVLSHDNYYKRHDDLTYEERTKLNYDHPDAFDTDLMIGHLRALKDNIAGGLVPQVMEILDHLNGCRDLMNVAGPYHPELRSVSVLLQNLEADCRHICMCE